MRFLVPLLLLFQPYAQSQPPAPIPREPKEAVQSKADPKKTIAPTNQQLSNALTALENKLDSEVSAREKLAEVTQQKKEVSPERWLKWSTVGTAIATFAIAVLGGFQWWAIRKQAEYMKAGLAETKKAADAATLSAEAAINIERPWIVVSRFAGPPLRAQDQNVVPMGCLFDFQNRGRTPARIIGVWARFHSTGNVLALPNPPDYRDMGPEIPPDQWKVMTPHDPPYTLRREFEEGRLGEERVQTIRQKQLFLICYGLLKYIDFAGGAHDLQFCYGYVMPDEGYPNLAEGWRIAGPPGYNRST